MVSNIGINVLIHCIRFCSFQLYVYGCATNLCSVDFACEVTKTSVTSRMESIQAKWDLIADISCCQDVAKVCTRIYYQLI